MDIAKIEVHPVSAERLADFLQFFDQEAFPDNPGWQSCYCQFALVDHAQVQWSERTLQQNRQAACARIPAGTMQGLLAYREGRPVGWCNAAPRTLLDAFADEPDPPGHPATQVGQITCFVVAPAQRRSGVATALLQAACERFRQQGLAIVEAVTNPDAATDAQSHHGPVALFQAAGFEHQRDEEDGFIVMRKRL
ncbi:MAG: GNAT family N-acetyltransferase [Pseudomonadota bacterium]|nr:GNAT family N-acetyltransferase [Pseudomonadota bacterium]